jgi:CDP-glycerol glycerophosphotransferase (TagB/SpsB family)
MKILFVSPYSEVLKTFIPLINHFTNFEICVIAKYIPSGPDLDKSKQIFKKYKLNGYFIENEVYSKNSKKSLFAKYKKLLLIKRSAYDYFEKIKPDVIIVGPDKNNLERFIIKRANQDLVPSICFQWSLGPITKRTFLETKYKKKYSEIQRHYESFFKTILNILRKKISMFLNKILGTYTAVYAACYGGGDSTFLAVVGKTSESFFKSMGVKKEKIIITGHPLLEEAFYFKKNKSENIFNLLNIPVGSKFILFCTGKYLNNSIDYLDGKSIFEWRRDKIVSILETSYSGFIIVKLHPVENLKTFKELEHISNRVRVTQEIDGIDLIRCCDILLTRYSTIAYYAMIYSKPVITHNFPSIPFGSYYDEIGGTIHVENTKDLIRILDLIINCDSKTLNLIENIKVDFLERHLNIIQKVNKNEIDILPSLQQFESLLNKVSSNKGVY